MKKTLLICGLLMCFFLMAVAGAPAYAKKTRAVMGTGSLGASMYVMATGLSKIWHDNVKDLSVAVQATGGSVVNLRLMGRKRLEFALNTNPTIASALAGEKEFAGKQDIYNQLRAVYTWAYGGMEFCVLADSGITKFSDLKGKKIAVGARGSSGALLAPIALAAHGVTKDNSDFRYLAAGDRRDQLKNNQIDCTINMTYPPQGTIMDLCLFRKIRLLGMEEDAMQKILKEIAGSSIVEIPAKVYGKNQVNTEPIRTIGFGGTLLTWADFDEDIIYRCVKSLFENIEDFQKTSAMCSRLTIKEAVNYLTIPLHKGAERYYREAGVYK